MNRLTLQRISELRTRDARTLLRNGHYAGAYYLIGYAVECALKACVATQIKRYDFPDKELVIKAYTHDLEQLVRVAGLEQQFDKARKSNKELRINWAVVKDWKVDARYKLDVTEAQAQDLFSACTARKYGILPWIKERW